MSEQTTTALAVSTPVPEILQKLNDKLASLQKVVDCPYKTNGEFGHGFANLKNETKVENLAKVLGIVDRKKEDYDAAYEKLGEKNYPVFKHNDFTAEEWFEDIKLRKAIIEHQETYTTLTELKKEAEQFMSQEDRKQLFLQKMEGLINKI